MKQKIGVVGLGMVGAQAERYFRSKKFEVFGHDKFRKIGSLKVVDNAKIIFLCLPTPYNEKTGYNTDILQSVIEFFEKPKIFVIKSTVLPGTTDALQKKYAQHYFLHNPEFLRDASAWKDFIASHIQIVGYTAKSKRFAKKILSILPLAPHRKIFTAKTTESIKLVNNSFLSLRVAFANEIYDITKKIGVDYDSVRDSIGRDARIGTSHFDVWSGGYRGFGGKCLPKDLKALIYFIRKNNSNGKVLEAADEENLKLLKKQKLMGRLDEWLDNKS
ncbi:MAG: hypothetical protein AAB920_03615 [Patescibacteria group bacterium]